jgi:hypothetical protein
LTRGIGAKKKSANVAEEGKRRERGLEGSRRDKDGMEAAVPEQCEEEQATATTKY